MNFEGFRHLVEQSRSTRRFKQNIPVQLKDLEDIIDVTRLSPSPKNMQPLKYVLVSDKNIADKISQSSKWAAHLEEWEQSKQERPSAYIIILNDTTIEGFEMIDLGIALQTIMLMLPIKGFAGCPLASIDKALCKKLFKLPKHLEPMLGIAIGIENETIRLVDVEEDGDTNYYRNAQDDHCVPKRTLNDVIVGRF